MYTAEICEIFEMKSLIGLSANDQPQTSDFIRNRQRKALSNDPAGLIVMSSSQKSLRRDLTVTDPQRSENIKIPKISPCRAWAPLQRKY